MEEPVENNSLEPLSKKQKKYPKILDGKYYKVQNDTDGNIEAICTICEEMRKGSIYSTGNFLSHYRNRHQSMIQDLKEHTKPDTVKKKPSLNQPTLAEVMAATPDKVASKILDFVIDGNLSFNTAQLPSLKDLLETVSGRKIAMPSRHKFMKTLDGEFSKMKTALREILSKQKYLCVTADVWSSRAQSYLGATVHFLNAALKRESYVLAFKQLYSKQTYKELAQEMDAIFKDYGIENSQITNIVTDGGSSFCKMFKIYGDSIDAVVSTYDDEETEEANENGDDPNANNNGTATSFMFDTHGEPFFNEILQFDNVDSNNLPHAHSITEQNDSSDFNEANSENNFMSYFGERADVVDIIKMPPQRRCVSHLLNLLWQYFEKRYLLGIAKTVLCQTLSKLHTLWILTHRSSQAKTICKTILGQILKVPCETRWNSRYDAVKMCSIPDIQRNLNKLIQKLKSDLNCASSRNLQTLTPNDFAVIEQYVAVLEPVAISLDLMQKEFNSSQGYIMPVLFSMSHRIKQIKESSNIASDFKAAMIKAIDNRFKDYFVFGETNKDLILAAITLPRIKTSFIAQDDNIIYAKNLLIFECKKLKNETFIEVPTTQEEPVLEQSENDFFVSYTALRDNRRNSLENEIESEVSRFLCDVRTDNSILNEYPNVRAAYFKYNTTISSSAPVERVFSQSLMIFTPRRNRLSAAHFEQALLMKHNRKLINDTQNV